MTLKWQLLIIIISSSMFLCEDIKFHEPNGGVQGKPPQARGPHLRRHSNIHVNLEEEREHLKEHVKEEYLDMPNMDDNTLLMQYFRKHDSDGNFKLDGLELLKAIARMEEDDHHHDDENEGETTETPEEKTNIPKLDINDIIPIIDSLLEQDDKNKDGYISWNEFRSRQKQNQNTIQS